ncbi:MAG: hypothetical protein ACJ0BI_08680 [Paracoccaceae bacterium]
MSEQFVAAVEEAKAEFQRLYDCGALPHGLFHMYQSSRLGVFEKPFDWETKLANSKENYDAFIALKSYCAEQIRAENKMPERLKYWIAAVIVDAIKPPKRKGGRPTAEKEFRLFLARLIFFIKERHNLKPTRNASSPPISACDAVSIAMNTLPAARGLKPNSFDELARIYSEAEKSGAFVS